MDPLLTALRRKRQILLYQLERVSAIMLDTEDVRIEISENRAAMRERIDAMRHELDLLRGEVETMPADLDQLEAEAQGSADILSFALRRTY